MVDNADWLLDLNYIEFLRDIGVHFSVNRMLTQNVLNPDSKEVFPLSSSTTCSCKAMTS